MTVDAVKISFSPVVHKTFEGGGEPGPSAIVCYWLPNVKRTPVYTLNLGTFQFDLEKLIFCITHTSIPMKNEGNLVINYVNIHTNSYREL